MPRYAQHMLDVESTLELSHTCSRCGHRARASVRALGQGTQYGGSFGGPSASQRAALEDEAMRSLAPDARESLGLVPCSKCGKRNLGTLAWVCARAFLFCGLVGVVIALFGMVGLDALGVFGSSYTHHPTSFYVLWGLAIFAPSAGLLELFIVLERVRRAKKAVQFHRDEPPPV